MRNHSRRGWGALLITALAVHASGCGTLLYPERKGQKDGKVDATVAILDGVGLLFFIIPGVIAFVVDFDNGTIYLPGPLSSPDSDHHNLFKNGESRRDTPDAEPWIEVHVGPGALDEASIRSVVAGNTGVRLDLDDPRLEIARVASPPGPRRE